MAATSSWTVDTAQARLGRKYVFEFRPGEVMEVTFNFVNEIPANATSFSFRNANYGGLAQASFGTPAVDSTNKLLTLYVDGSGGVAGTDYLATGTVEVDTSGGSPIAMYYASECTLRCRAAAKA